MTDQLPADIAEAIEALIGAVAYETEDGFCVEAERCEQARAALDAVILKHLRATDQTNTGE